MKTDKQKLDELRQEIQNFANVLRADATIKSEATTEDVRKAMIYRALVESLEELLDESE